VYYRQKIAGGHFRVDFLPILVGDTFFDLVAQQLTHAQVDKTIVFLHDPFTELRFADARCGWVEQLRNIRETRLTDDQNHRRIIGQAGRNVVEVQRLHGVY
jgi:hypothetical protein